MATYIGIDIGSCYSKVVELEYNPAPILLNYIIFQTPFLSQVLPGLASPFLAAKDSSSSGRAGLGQIDAKIFWQEITKHIPLERIRTAHIATSLPSNAVSAITLLLPRLAKNELAIAAHTEARRKMIPVSTAGHVFESSIIGTRIVAKIPRFEVLVVRSEGRFIQQILELFQAINVVPELISCAGYSLFNLLPAEAADKKDVDSAFVDISYNSINTSILREGRLNFFRSTPFGIQDIIQDISKQLGIPENIAAEVIKENGVPEVNFDLKNRVVAAEEIMRQKYEAGKRAEETGIKQGVNLLELRMLWQAYIERITHELRRSFAFYKEQSDGRRVEYIYFLGGSCQIKNLINLLMQHIGGQWEIVLPFKGMRAGTLKENEWTRDTCSSPIFTGAVSLGLTMGMKKTKRAELINFLPLELKRKREAALKHLIFLIIKIALAGALALLSIFTFINSRLIKAAIKKTETELSKIKDVSDALKELNAHENKIKQRSAQIEELIRKRPDFLYHLNVLSGALPEEILLTAVSIHKAVSGDSGLAPAAVETDMLLDEIAAAQTTNATVIPEENYRIKINADLFADYETAASIIEAFRNNLQISSYFSNIIIAPLKLEKISPHPPPSKAEGKSGISDQEIALTEAMNRSFVLTAEIIFKPGPSAGRTGKAYPAAANGGVGLENHSTGNDKNRD